MTTQPDIFTNVHPGIRAALFEACSAAGRACGASPELEAARAMARDALHFVAHHGENEDLLILPLLRERAPMIFDRIACAHERTESALLGLSAKLDTVPATELYHALCDFTALYLRHLQEEELELEPAIRAAISNEELASFGRRAVERTAPADQRTMLSWIMTAVTSHEAEALLARVPETLATELRARRKQFGMESER